MKRFRGRIVAPGKVSAPALVTVAGMDLLASFQKALQSGDKTVICADRNNSDLFGKTLGGKAICLPGTVGDDVGGMILYCACAMKQNPACLLFSQPIDAVAASGAILASAWLDDVKMPVIDNLGEAFLRYVENGMTVTIEDGGVVCVD